jgi:hypothetical protein
MVTSTYALSDAASAMAAVLQDPTQVKVHITSDATP